ncbi:hypothetical protein SOVF_050200 [Spinacia oleracea]|uniref:DUF829 domain-containing protein n=1 Tax=Spinacia oleracea TaxID=3562 RepID=A0A9R0K4D8_SPIOL|nr:uncharacterized protein LOC110796377 [Spinacia oleracea]KNA20660.1 hypothetical protein SOVF_050200 [Spinacia oleracea]
MWGFGGRYYWGRRERVRKSDGIVVVFGWMSSEERHLKHYIDLYASLGWNSLVCHSQFLNSFFPDKATFLALNILDELIEELKANPCPVVFASFSGGPKACMYKVLQIIEGKCKTPDNQINYQALRDYIAGHIYDSSPVDFTSDLGTRFVLHPSVLKVSNPPRFVSWLANGIASGLDGLFLSRFESQRAEYWQTLYSSVTMGAPYLIMCSEDDNLAPCETICNFARRLQELGGDVKLVKWTSSPHVGHYRQHPVDYKGAVTELLGKASAIQSQRTRRLEGGAMGFEGSRDDISEPIGDLRKATARSNDIFKKLSVELAEHAVVPKSSFEYDGGRAVGSVQDEKPGLVQLPSPPRINANGVLGQILFDVCVPKNIEEWDVGPLSSLRQSPFPSTRRHSMHFNPIKCIRRPRL